MLDLGLVTFLASFAIGVLAGGFSGLVGGAAGTVAIPLFLIAGVPPYSAIAITRAGGLGIALGSIASFRGTGLARWQVLQILIPIAIIAAFVGVFALTAVPGWVIPKIVAVLLIVSAVALYIEKGTGEEPKQRGPIIQILGYSTYFISEALRSAFGSGFGMITRISLVTLLGMTMLESSATNRIASLLVTGISLVIFIVLGLVDLVSGTAMFFGCLMGSYYGTKLSLVAGNTNVKHLFLVYAVCMAGWLLISGDYTLLG